MASLRACLFDLDGTLLDTIELILRSYEHALSERGFAPLGRGALLEHLGRTLFDSFSELTSDPREVAALTEAYRAFNLRHHDDLVRPYAGVHEALELVRASGLRVGIVTSKMRTTALRGLERCGLPTEYDAFVAMEDCTRHKPHPEPLERALCALRLEPGACAYLGDSPHDVAAANAIRVRALVAGWGPFEPEHFAALDVDRRLAHPRELPAALGVGETQRARE